MKPPSAPPTVAFFDSGVGGFTVLEAVLRRRPDVATLYIADQAHVPYGGRDLHEIEGFARRLTQSLLGAGADLVVMACNVSSATYGPRAEDELGPHRALGVLEPGARAALQASRTRRIGVLATEGTVRSEAYARTLSALAPDAQTAQVACPRFVPLIEAGRLEGPETDAAVDEAVSRLEAAQVDVAILGCTHYPFLLPALRRRAPQLTFVDPADATAEVVANWLPAPVRSPLRARHRWWTTGHLDDLSAFVDWPQDGEAGALRLRGSGLQVPGAGTVETLSWPGLVSARKGALVSAARP